MELHSRHVAPSLLYWLLLSYADSGLAHAHLHHQSQHGRTNAPIVVEAEWPAGVAVPKGPAAVARTTLPPAGAAAQPSAPANLDAAVAAEATKAAGAGPFGGDDGRLAVLLSLAVGALVLVAAAVQARRHASTDEHLSEGKDIEVRRNKVLAEDTYGFAIASFVRDSSTITQGHDHKLRASRMVMAYSVLLFNILIQGFVMYQISKFAAAKWVHDIRVDYDEYELHMYGSEPGHTTLTVNGKHRGVLQYFTPANFDTLDDDLKERVCNIPFSRPNFFVSILLLWTLTVISELRQCQSLFMSLVVMTPGVDSMTDALKECKEEAEDKDRGIIIVGLTKTVKIFICFGILLPRFIVSCVLGWLGSRFLAATNDFSELVLNAVALEFLLAVKDLLYHTIVPERNKRDTATTEIRPSRPQEPASYWAFLGTFTWGYIAIVWVYYYMFVFQSVLPDYKWDVNSLCTPWLAERYAV